jgi:hypothetical protein
MKLRLLATHLAAAAALAGAADVSCRTTPLPNDAGWCDCSSNYGLELKSVSISPPLAHVRPGQNLTISVVSHNDKTVTGGELRVYEALDCDQVVVDKTYDLCKDSSITKCPIEAHEDRVVNLTETVPSDAPVGVYTGKMQARDQDNHEILCVLYNVNVAAAAVKKQPDFFEKDGPNDDCCLQGDCCRGVTFCCQACDGNCTCCHFDGTPVVETETPAFF